MFYHNIALTNSASRKYSQYFETPRRRNYHDKTAFYLLFIEALYVDKS